MADRKGPSAVSSIFIKIAYLGAIALELLLLCKTWWKVAALVGIGFVMFWVIMFFVGLAGIKRHSAVHVTLIADLVISPIIYKITSAIIYKIIFG